MIRKLTIALVSGIVCLLLGVTPVLAQYQYNSMKEYEKATGKKIEKFNEAPMLRTRVAAGELPPVEERLPEDPVVVTPVEEIGQYGGTVRIPYVGADWVLDVTFIRGIEPLLRLDTDLTTILPNLADRWEFSEDGKTLTIYLHKGIKWSDGVPFNADDIMFWYKDIFLNKELTPVINPKFQPGGKVIKVEKVDDYTVQMHSAVPYPVMEIMLVSPYGLIEPFEPAHYLKQFHIKYNPKADELAKKNGFDYWYQYFNEKRRKMWITVPLNPDLPTLGAFRCAKQTTDYYIFERNPYYWKVDPEGNQLPYIDKIFCTMVSDKEVLNGKVISGEADFGWMFTHLFNYTLYKENEKSGHYKVIPWPSGLLTVYEPNQTHKDPVLRKIFQDIRFRRALSLAINREEINDVVYYGLGVPSQLTLLPGSTYFEPEFRKAYAEYDPEKANQLLDEMGLKWDKNHEYRLRPDGKRLGWVTQYWRAHIFHEPENELVKEYWKKIGLDVDFKGISADLYRERCNANLLDMGIWCGAYLNDVGMHLFPAYFVPVGTWENAWGNPWARWCESGGEEGEEPPERVKKLYEWWQKMNTTMDKEERIRLGKKILASQAENLWTIGTVAQLPLYLCIIKDNLANFPKADRSTPPIDDATGYNYAWHPEQLFLKRPLYEGQK